MDECGIVNIIPIFRGVVWRNSQQSIYSRMTWMCWLQLAHCSQGRWPCPTISPSLSISKSSYGIRDELPARRWRILDVIIDDWLGKSADLAGEISFVKPLKKEWWFPAFPADFDFPGNSCGFESYTFWSTMIFTNLKPKKWALKDASTPSAARVLASGCASGPIWRIQRISSTAASAHWDSPIDIYDLSDLSNTPTSGWIFAKKKHRSQKTSEWSFKQCSPLSWHILPHHQKWAPAPKRDCE